jgi:hypothetical protein
LQRCSFARWASVKAQTVDSSLQNIRPAIIQATGVSNASVDLKISDKIFLVSRINSPLNQANHSTRDDDELITMTGSSTCRDG